jgi:hypothetical protein
MSPHDAVANLAQELADSGMVMKAVLIYDTIDEDGSRDLNFAVTEDMTVWDLQGMLTGLLNATGKRFGKSG